MIIAEQKPIEEILEMLAPHKKILLAGCGACVTVCQAGGEKEVGVLASQIRMARKEAGNPIEIIETTLTRQCEPEFMDEAKDLMKDVEAVLSIACGIGVQLMAQTFYDKPAYPGLNTKFLGLPEEHGVFTERCAACGDCVLHLTGGICPIARCSKSLLNGPCGGSQNGKCEINTDVDCAWQLIYDRLKAIGKLDNLTEIIPPKKWITSRDGGPRKIVREDLRI
ncbi:MAG: methylenetetrahydrofolate reductase C-terminal domain-containing protein [Deltaproteobacteria bacterium]|nr:methylenetetrahydrofolate reductase C-terminal domain-containing protein [Deltaproteobacteria bacterium]